MPTKEHNISSFLEAEAGSHRCCPSTNIQSLWGGSQHFPRHATCQRSHELIASSRLWVCPFYQCSCRWYHGVVSTPARFYAVSYMRSNCAPGGVAEQFTAHQTLLVALRTQQVGAVGSSRWFRQRFQQVVSSESKTRRSYGKSEWTKRESSRRKV